MTQPDSDVELKAGAPSNVPVDPPRQVDEGVLTAQSRAELDQQITTARAYPRSVTQFRQEALSLATLNEQVAESCLYAVPRAGGVIEGPSVRLAEIICSTWGNAQAGARVIDIGAEFITAEGVFYDLQRNVKITMHVQRRITNKSGKRFSADVIQSTGNAACSIALRNAVFRAVPQAFWQDIYKAARMTAIGELETLDAKRKSMLAYLVKLGVTEERVLSKLDVDGVQDINRDHLATIAGVCNAIKDGAMQPEEAFPPVDEKPKQQKGAGGLKERVAEKKAQSSTDGGAK